MTSSKALEIFHALPLKQQFKVSSLLTYIASVRAETDNAILFGGRKVPTQAFEALIDEKLHGILDDIFPTWDRKERRDWLNFLWEESDLSQVGDEFRNADTFYIHWLCLDDRFDRRGNLIHKGCHLAKAMPWDQ